MPASECSFCGSLTITEDNVCTSCATLVSPKVATTSQPQFEQPRAQNSFPNPPSARVEQPAFPVSSPFPPRRERTFEADRVEPQASCLRCGTEVPRGQGTCVNCASSQKSTPHVRRIALVVAAVVFAFLGYSYGYEYVSAYGVLNKYENATNSDAEFEGFTFKGTVTVSEQHGFGDPAALETDLGKPRTGEEFDFRMAYQTPGKSAVEMVRNGDIIFKEVYDGVSGWSIDTMNGQSGVQDKKDGFGLKKMGIGIDDFDSVEFLGSSAERDFALGRSILLRAKSTLNVNSEKLTLGDKVAVKANMNRKGAPDPTVLVFDRSSGLLVGMVKEGKLGPKDITTVVFFDDYKRFSFKDSGVFKFLRKGQVLVPTKWTFVIGLSDDPRRANPPSIVMSFDVTDIDLLSAVDPAIFKKPGA